MSSLAAAEAVRADAISTADALRIERDPFIELGRFIGKSFVTAQFEDVQKTEVALIAELDRFCRDNTQRGMIK